jgi:hypothetical protein
LSEAYEVLQAALPCRDSESKTTENHPSNPALSHLGHGCIVIAVIAAFDNHDFNA